ncbi:MAG: site-2 protease family protein, partial [Ardenticatenaceae bacterium]
MWSWRIGSIRGIELRIHFTFPLVLLWAAFQFGGGEQDSALFALYGAFLILLLFGCVLLHELGHALVALRFNVPVDEIVLLPIGGLARLRALNDDPREELTIAVAGPLVNVAIALLLLPLYVWLIGATSSEIIGRIADRTGGSELQALLLLLARSMQEFSVEGMLAYLIIANLLLTLFNLIPAFPMDGGRIFRALLAFFLPYRWASIAAVRTGQL